MSSREYLSKREQQIMELIYRHGKMSAVEIQEGLPGKLANSSVRTFLTILEKKGVLQHEEEGAKFLYFASKAREDAAKSAVHSLLNTFFGGSLGACVATLLSDREANLSEEDIAEIKNLIAKAEASK